MIKLFRAELGTEIEVPELMEETFRFLAVVQHRARAGHRTVMPAGLLNRFWFHVTRDLPAWDAVCFARIACCARRRPLRTSHEGELPWTASYAALYGDTLSDLWFRDGDGRLRCDLQDHYRSSQRLLATWTSEVVLHDPNAEPRDDGSAFLDSDV